ncbi:MAG: transglycosylase SLT domain-containing protein [Candidatus Edwardsbacteria bacterium]
MADISENFSFLCFKLCVLCGLIFFLTGCAKRIPLNEPVIEKESPLATSIPSFSEPVEVQYIEPLPHIQPLFSLDSDRQAYKLIQFYQQSRIPLVFENRYNVARAYFQLREYERAAFLLDSLLATDSLSANSDSSLRREALFLWAKTYFRAGKIEKGIEKLKEAKRSFPEEPRIKDINLQLGLAYENLNQKSLAKKFYQAAIKEKHPLQEYVQRHIWQCSKNSSSPKGRGLSERRTLSYQKKDELKFSKTVQLKPQLGPEDRPLPRRKNYLFNLARSYLKQGAYTQAINAYRQFIWQYPKHPQVPEAYYLIGFCLEQKGEFAMAIAAYSDMNQKYPRSSLSDEAIFRQGLCEYKCQNYQAAAYNWQKLLQECPQSNLWEEAGFWSGMAAEKIGCGERATEMYQQIMERNPRHYYGWQAKERLLALAEEKDPPNYSETKVKDWFLLWCSLAKDSLPAKIKDRVTKLLEVGFIREGTNELQELENLSESNPFVLWELAKIYNEYGLDNKAMWCAQKIFALTPADLKQNPPKELLEMLYPIKYVSSIESNLTNNQLDRNYILAVMREESWFKPKDVSWAGAVGLMQIIPATGRKIAKELGYSRFKVQDLYNPYLSIRFGIHFLSSLYQQFDNSLELAACAYNAGPSPVKKWRNNYFPEEINSFIEDIPYSQTREYIKKVMASYWVYQQMDEE